MLFKNHHKNIAAVLKVLFCGIAFFVACVLLSSCENKTRRVNDAPVSVKCDEFRYPNIKQDKTAIQMQAIDGSLYIYMPESRKEAAAVFKFDCRGASKLEKMFVFKRYGRERNDRFAGFGNGYLYIVRYPAKETEGSSPEKAELVYYELASGDSGTLVKNEESAYMDVMFDEEGLFYVSTGDAMSDGEKQYHIIRKDMLLSEMATEPIDLRSGSAAEALRAYNNVFPMLSEEQLNNAIESLRELGLAHRGCELYPREDGLLLQMGKGHIPLCFVSFDGCTMPVMEYECFSSSTSFNYYGNYAFLSLIRYEKWDDTWGYFLEPYENDSISGTYRIDLTDYSIEKINDNYYSGIFIFDEANIYVCDKKQGVYQMDSDGNVINTLIYPNS